MDRQLHVGAVAEVMPPGPRRWTGSLARPWVLCALAGLLFLVAFQGAYGRLDPDIYRFRDDGIITLSHGRNWVDFGFIGVNPSGERLEATSAPLQMLLYAAAYGATGIGYAAFAKLQTLLCTFALGWLFAALFVERPLFALAGSAAAAFFLSRAGSFLVWHGSGMENALVHVFLLWTVVMLHRAAGNASFPTWWAIVPFLASIVRVEGIYYVGPLLAVFCIQCAIAGHGREARRFAAVVGALWLLFNAARYAYFGSLLPNTAIAQGISVGDRLIEFATLSPSFMDQSFSLARAIFTSHATYLLLLALPPLLLRARSRDSVALLALAGTIIMASLAAPFVFGPARLDVTRTTTQLALFVAVAVACALYGWQPRRADAYSMSVAALAVFLIHDYAGVGPYKICCSSRGFDATRARMAMIARENGIARPTIANPDLGVMSWHKQFNVVDLGFLGSAVTAQLREDDLATRTYLLDYAAPDLVESHGWWSCRHAATLADAQFRERYVFAGEPGAATTIPCKGAAAITGLWIRRDVMRGSPSAERLLMDDLARSPSVERVQRELASCMSAHPPTPAGCAYVARSVYRALPEFRARGMAPALEKVFAGSPSRDFDLFLVKGSADGRAYRAFVDHLARSASP